MDWGWTGFDVTSVGGNPFGVNDELLIPVDNNYGGNDKVDADGNAYANGLDKYEQGVSIEQAVFDH